jgi:hypothetical protein
MTSRPGSGGGGDGGDSHRQREGPGNTLLSATLPPGGSDNEDYTTHESSVVTYQLTTPLDPKSADYEERISWLGARITHIGTRQEYKRLQTDILSGLPLGDDVSEEIDRRHNLLEGVGKMKSESRDLHERDPFYGRDHTLGIEEPIKRTTI